MMPVSLAAPAYSTVENALTPILTPESGSERFHRLLYLGLQRLRRRPLGAYIRKLQEWDRLDPVAFGRLRAERMVRTLDYARERVPLYRSELWRQAFQFGNSHELSAWPLLEREMIQCRGSELLAQPTPSGHYFRLTSGSTGKPLGVGMDPDAAAWAWASDYRGLSWHGIRVGARCLSFRGRHESAFKEWIRHHKAMGAANLSEARLTEGVRYMQNSRPTYVWGFVSAIVDLARQARKIAPSAAHPLVPFAKVFGEMLYPFQRQEIQESLGARVIETYGCNETGTVAYECPAGSLHVFAEHVEVEILIDGQPAGPGDMGDIVLTCTTNSAMPLIRYRVGDRGRLSPDPCSCGRPHPVLCDIQGRVGDVLLTAAGGRVHGTAALGGLLKKVHARGPKMAIGQVLFEQHDHRTWTVLVQPGPGFGAAVAADLASSVRSVFGEQCRVVVKPVPEIPREPSGKFRFYRTSGPSAVEPSP
jgi:phenylacetate-coenzyme A ligase PaaK-like adenylate-forming protein